MDTENSKPFPTEEEEDLEFVENFIKSAESAVDTEPHKQECEDVTDESCFTPSQGPMTSATPFPKMEEENKFEKASLDQTTENTQAASYRPNTLNKDDFVVPSSVSKDGNNNGGTFVDFGVAISGDEGNETASVLLSETNDQHVSLASSMSTTSIHHVDNFESYCLLLHKANENEDTVPTLLPLSQVCGNENAVDMNLNSDELIHFLDPIIASDAEDSAASIPSNTASDDEACSETQFLPPIIINNYEESVPVSLPSSDAASYDCGFPASGVVLSHIDEEGAVSSFMPSSTLSDSEHTMLPNIAKDDDDDDIVSPFMHSNTNICDRGTFGCFMLSNKANSNEITSVFTAPDNNEEILETTEASNAANLDEQTAEFSIFPTVANGDDCASVDSMQSNAANIYEQVLKISTPPSEANSDEYSAIAFKTQNATKELLMPSNLENGGECAAAAFMISSSVNSNSTAELSPMSSSAANGCRHVASSMLPIAATNNMDTAELTMPLSVTYDDQATVASSESVSNENISAPSTLLPHAASNNDETAISTMPIKVATEYENATTSSSLACIANNNDEIAALTMPFVTAEEDNNSLEPSSLISVASNHEVIAAASAPTCVPNNNLDTTPSSLASSAVKCDAANVESLPTVNAFNDIESTAASSITTNDSVSLPNTPATGESKDNANNYDQLLQDGTISDILGTGDVVVRYVKKVPDAPYPMMGDRALISYAGKLLDGRIIEGKENFEIHVRDYEVPWGLDLTISLMRVGEEAEVIVSPFYAYGAQGNAKLSVPPNSAIIYFVQLHSFVSEFEEDYNSAMQRRLLGLRKRTFANDWFQRGDYLKAIHLYKRALFYLDAKGQDEFSDEEIEDLQADRLVVYNNLAMANLKTYNYPEALLALEEVLKVQPTNSKALYRKGLALRATGNLEDAIESLKKAALHEKDKADIEKELSKMMIELRREKLKQKELYRKMLGQVVTKKKAQQPKESPRAEPNNTTFPTLLVVLGTLAFTIVGIAVYRARR